MSLKSELDVVDSWEEIDEAVINSQLNKLTKNINSNTQTSSIENQTTNDSTSAILNMYDQEFRPQIIQRPVTILRRAESTQSNDPNFIDKNKAATKSFKSYEQRQQEYAQARLRILGAAKNPEEDASQDDDKNVIKLAATNSIDTTTNQMNGSINGFSNKTTNQSAVPSASKNISLARTQNEASPITVKSQENVTRQPNGPNTDGSQGFNFKR